MRAGTRAAWRVQILYSIVTITAVILTVVLGRRLPGNDSEPEQDALRSVGIALVVAQKESWLLLALRPAA